MPKDNRCAPNPCCRNPGEGEHGCGGPKRQLGHDRKRCQRERSDADAGAAEFGQPVAPQQVIHRGCVDVHAGYRIAGEGLAGRRRRQRAALGGRTFGRGDKTRRCDFAVLDVEHRADQHDLAVEMAVEEVLVVLLDAGAQIGERKGRNVASAAGEVEGDLAGHGARGGDLRRRRRRGCARGKLRGHGGNRLGIDREFERHAPDHAAGIVVDVQRSYVACESDRGALAGRGQDRFVLVLDLTEHDLPGASAKRKRAQIVPVEPAEAGAKGFVAERHRRLLDRRRKYDVETHDLGASVEDRGQDPADLGGPGDARTAFERRRPERFLIERNNDRGRGGRRMRVAEGAPARLHRPAAT